jgi:beta-xylosidase
MSSVRPLVSAALVSLASLGACAKPPGRAPAAPGNVFTNPVMPGDFPDPSVIRVGNEYWATATSSQWGPPFPLLRSTNLVDWAVVGSVLERPPAWSAGSYWAPEIATHAGRYFVYYTARKRDGPLCVAVATAASPGGPYRDHGPMVCQEAGSIDAMPITDENGQRYLVWKEDGNSRKRPTPLWAQRLSADGTQLVGEPTEILRNDQPWEGALVEGPFVMLRGGWFYMFYSGNACCGRSCDYALGVARARKLLGPWEKNPANPILKASEDWKCPGHGSIVSDPAGRDYLLYHAYHSTDFVHVGRQGLLERVDWGGADDWPTINGGAGPSARAPAPVGAADRGVEHGFADEFHSAAWPGWQWPQGSEPSVRVEPADGGWLVLSPRGQRAQDPVGAVFGRATTTGNYVATTRVGTGLSAGVSAGLAAYGNETNAVGVALADGRVAVWQRTKGEHTAGPGIPAPAGTSLYLRLTAREGQRFRFAASGDGRAWTDIGGEVSGEHLPPWDLGVRVALTAGGATDAAARFDWLRIEPLP